MGLKQAKSGFACVLTVAVAPKGMVFAVDNWAQGLKDSTDNQKKAIRTAIRKFWDFLKERAQSRGITKDELLKDPFFARMQESELKKWRNERLALEQYPDGSTRLGRGVEAGKMDYERYRRECYYPLFGSEKDGIKGLIPLARMALTGDRRLKKRLKPGADKIITGEPICICPPEKRKEFRKELNHQIHESGRVIIQGGLTAYDVNAQNAQLTRLIERYRSPEIESHVNFIVVSRQGGTDTPGRKLLALDIKVSYKSLNL
jgi:hypothetical protein